MSAGSCRCIECDADVSWVAGQSPALWCPGCRPSAEEAYEAGRIEGAERALLERDVGEVERAMVPWRRVADATQESFRGLMYQEIVELYLTDCTAWLARAKAVLG